VSLVDSKARAAAAGGPRRTEKSAGGGAAGVEIAGFPQILFTRTFGDPDMLFIPLLDAAREAFNTIERLCGHGEKRDNAVLLSGMQLASSLLRDSSFSLVARGLSHDNSYMVDLENGTLLAQTRLFAVVSRRTSFFKVEIVGKLNEGLFVVRNPMQNMVIMQVEEERLRQPNFFSTTLAQECLRSQMEHERFGRIEESIGPQANQELRMIASVAGNMLPVILRQKEVNGAWDIVDGRRQEWVGTLAPELEGPLGAVIQAVKELFEKK
jgi:hypothetical protein